LYRPTLNLERFMTSPHIRQLMQTTRMFPHQTSPYSPPRALLQTGVSECVSLRNQIQIHLGPANFVSTREVGRKAQICHKLSRSRQTRCVIMPHAGGVDCNAYPWVAPYTRHVPLLTSSQCDRPEGAPCSKCIIRAPLGTSHFFGCDRTKLPDLVHDFLPRKKIHFSPRSHRHPTYPTLQVPRPRCTK
jgi:hypothetical protein